MANYFEYHKGEEGLRLFLKSLNWFNKECASYRLEIKDTYHSRFYDRPWWLVKPKDRYISITYKRIGFISTKESYRPLNILLNPSHLDFLFRIET